MNRGFSIAEVMVALLLLSTVSLSLLKLQLHQQQQFNQLHLQQLALQLIDNTSEVLLAGHTPLPAKPPFELTVSSGFHEMDVVVRWLSRGDLPIKQLKRRFFQA